MAASIRSWIAFSATRRQIEWSDSMGGQHFIFPNGHPESNLEHFLRTPPAFVEERQRDLVRFSMAQAFCSSTKKHFAHSARDIQQCILTTVPKAGLKEALLEVCTLGRGWRDCGHKPGCGRGCSVGQVCSVAGGWQYALPFVQHMHYDNTFFVRKLCAGHKLYFQGLGRQKGTRWH